MLHTACLQLDAKLVITFIFKKVSEEKVAGKVPHQFPYKLHSLLPRLNLISIECEITSSA